MTAKKDAVPQEIATWMLEKLKVEREIYQDLIAMEIDSMFGEQFAHVDEAGNLAIHPEVLAAFKTLSGDQVVLDHPRRLWRMRQQRDEPTW